MSILPVVHKGSGPTAASLRQNEPFRFHLVVIRSYGLCLFRRYHSRQLHIQVLGNKSSGLSGLSFDQKLSGRTGLCAAASQERFFFCDAAPCTTSGHSYAALAGAHFPTLTQPPRIFHKTHFEYQELNADDGIPPDTELPASLAASL